MADKEYVVVRMPRELAESKIGTMKLLTMLKNGGAVLVECLDDIAENLEKVAANGELDAASEPVTSVWDYFVEKLGPHFGRAPKPLPKRLQIIRARLRRWSVDDLKAVIDFVAESPFHLGQNDRGRKYVDLDHIMGNDLKVERKLNERAAPGSSERADKIESLRLTLRRLGQKLRTNAATLDDKHNFSRTNDELRKLTGERYRWQSDDFMV